MKDTYWLVIAWFVVLFFVVWISVLFQKRKIRKLLAQGKLLDGGECRPNIWNKDLLDMAWGKFFLNYLLSVAIIVYGVTAVVNRQASYKHFTYYGFDAICIGMGCICLGLLVLSATDFGGERLAKTKAVVQWIGLLGVTATFLTALLRNL